MIRTGAEYIESIQDGRQVWVNGEQVADVPTHPYFQPLVNIWARMYDMQHEEGHQNLLTYHDEASGETNPMFYKPPKIQQDWWDKYNGVNAIMFHTDTDEH